jgi:hypothetical protein
VLREPGGKRCGVFLDHVETVSWQAPPFEAPSSTKIGWIEDMLSESEGWLSGQKSYKNLASNLAVFNGLFKDKAKSVLVTNGLRYAATKFVTTLAEVREIAAYGSDVKAYKQMAEMLTKVSKCVYLESDFPIQILRVLQYATVMGIGYLWPKVRPTEYGYGPREMVFDALGLLDVMPTQIPSRSNDIQDAYSVTIYDYMPIAESYGRFPLYQGKLQTVGVNSYKSLIQAKRQDFAASYRYGDLQDQGKSFGNLYTEIRYTFIRDLRINNTGFEMQCGEPGTSWYYKVPYIGQDIFGGIRNGQPYMRPAMAEDCRLYPNLRLIISSNGLDRPMYDGTAFDWDPNIPVIQYTVDDVPWEPGGRSLVGAVASIQTTIRKFERLIDQTSCAEKDPALGYNADENGGPKIEHWDPFESGTRLGLFGGGKPRDTLQSLLPEGVAVKSIDFELLKYYHDSMFAELGLNDVGNIANIKINMSADDAQKQIESIGPIGKGIAMRLEKANKKVGERVKYLIPQWFDTQRLIEYVGEDHIAREVFDYNPDDMVPSHLPDEMLPTGQFPTTPSMYDKLTRAKWLVKKLRLISVPSMLLKLTAQAEQLKYLQLKRQPDCPLSWSTCFEKLDVPNPKEEIEKYFKEQMQLTKMKLMAAAMAQKEMQELGLQPPEEQGGGKGGGKGGGLHAGGRPPSGQRPPKLAQKGGAGGAARTVVKES